MRLIFLLLSPVKVSIAERIIKRILNFYPFDRVLKKTSFYKISLVNISMCFQNNSPKENEQIAYNSFIESIISIYETLYSWSRSEQQIATMLFKQRNRFLLSRNKKALNYSIHNRSIDLLLSFFMLQNTATTLYKPIKYSGIDRYVIKQRTKKNNTVATASISGVKAVLKSHKDGRSVCFAADQVPANGLGQVSHFFNQKCYSSHLVEAISSRKGIATCFTYLTKSDHGYEVVTKNYQQKPLKTNDMNKVFESAIIKNPKEYAWEYKKFRKIPENKNLYKL